MSAALVRVAWTHVEPREALIAREWLVANGLGGYAAGTLGGVSTRRYHGLLVAALPGHGRIAVVSRLDETVQVGAGGRCLLEGVELADGRVVSASSLVEVRFEEGLPVWTYEVDGAVLEKRVLMPHARNTTYVAWRLVRAPAAVPVLLAVRPGLYVRSHEGEVGMPPGVAYPVEAREDGWRVELPGDLPVLEVKVRAPSGWSSTLAAVRLPELEYSQERDRGYPHTGALSSPGELVFRLAPGGTATVVLTVEREEHAPDGDFTAALEHERVRRARLLDQANLNARSGFGAELVLAADSFLVRPSRRTASEHARTVIAGYHWFTDWGRDTMISLEGLALLTGRYREAHHVLTTFAAAVRDGLLPNLFPEGASEGLYHTADATMWFFHAIDRYVAYTGDRDTLRALLPTLIDIVERHVRGTRFGIHVDPSDDLLSQGAAGYQLTWMDAKVDGWVVTPRRGKAVEINALWFNALTLLARWLGEESRAGAEPLRARADRVRASFNRRFWNDRGGYLFDVVDGESGDDDAIRPNQIFAVSLPNPVLEPGRWERVVAVVRESLFTPVGLRSLAPNHPDYKPRYDGDLRARDAAYHQGSVWAWLAGPFVDACLRVRPDDLAGARRILAGFEEHLVEACVGSISEIFDAEPPYTPRGCVSQAWSVAEVLRAWVRTAT